MSDPSLPHGQLPPIPDGCGIMPVAENRIARGPHPELLDAVPEGFAPLCSQSAPAALTTDALSNDAMEQMYRLVLSRAVALAACALFFAAFVAASLTSNPALQQNFIDARILIRGVFLAQILIAAFCSRFVEKLPIVPAAAILFSYACFCALEFSALLNPATLAVAFLCAGLLYATTAIYGYTRNADLARPITGILMLIPGGIILIAVNLLLHTTYFVRVLSSVSVFIFTGLLAYFAQQIRDFYQDFDDDNALGWKASVLGALLLLVNSVNFLIVVAAFLSQFEDRTIRDD